MSYDWEGTIVAKEGNMVVRYDSGCGVRIGTITAEYSLPWLLWLRGRGVIDAIR